MGIKAAFDRQSFRQSGARPSQNSIPALPTDPQTREGFELPPSTEHLHPLSVDRIRQPDASNSAGELPVEDAAGRTSSLAVPSSMSDAQLDADLDSTSIPNYGGQKGRSTVAIELGEQDHTAGCVMALPQMGSLEEVVGVGCKRGQHCYEGDDADLGATSQEAGETRFDHQVSCPPEQDQTSSSHSMAVGIGHERSPPTFVAEDFGKQQCVAADSGSSQATSPNSVSVGRRPYEAHPQKVDRQVFGNIMSCLLLVNDDVQCYVNATFLTIMWLHLMCGDFHEASWGDLTTTFLGIVMDGQTQPLSLRNQSQLQSGFSQWQQLRGEASTTQQDFGEFLHYFLSWIRSRHVALTTSRRFIIADQMKTADKSAAHAPILLHSDLWHDLPRPILFQTVIHQWQHSNGMIQALEQASHIVCCQICRFKDTNSLDRTAIELGTLRVMLPCFTDSRLSIANIPYHIAALVHYNGNSKGGHYNCVIAHLDKYGDWTWLFHEDKSKPTGWKMIPEWFLYDVTHVWLIRCDQHHPWKPTSDGTLSQESALANVLAQLRDP